MQALNKWLTLNNEYNRTQDLSTIGYKPHRALSALTGNTGTAGPVCDGYARAFKLLCDRMGIPCILQSGWAFSAPGAQGENHMWNQVRTEDGNWYGVDICWDDPVVKDVSAAMSGKENENWLFAGAETVINGLKFGDSHQVQMQTDGDATMLMAADFQDPPELIDKYVEGWEEGYKIVIGIKEHSSDDKFIYALRCLYYKMIRAFSQVEQIEHFTGFGLYDHAFMDVLRELDDPTPFLRGIVAELGFRRKEIPYSQPKRRAGRTSNNFYTLYDAAMLSFTSYTKIGLRIATFAGAICAGISMLVAIVYLVMKLIWWERFPAGTAPMLIGMLFLGSAQIFFIGLLGEYILGINQRVMKRPLVVEEERLNF